MKKVYLIISIDTECDKSPDWSVQQPLSFQNIRDQEKTLMPLFEKYNIKPTYLLSPEVLKDEESVEYFRSIQDKIELGTHLHSEFIEPNCDMSSKATSQTQCNLSLEQEKLKLKNLTNLFVEVFGVQPMSFRAGRFGVSSNTLKLLSKLNYKVDSSYVPFKNFKFKASKVFGWGTSIFPYVEHKILEVPVTHFSPNYINIPLFINNLLKNKNSYLSKLAVRLIGDRKTYWLRPLRHSKNQLVDVAEVTINDVFKKREYAILNIMFHSNEITPGCSPYCLTDTDVKNYIKDLDFLFNHLQSNYDLCSIGLGESYNYLSQS
jgi:hypothetical protein